MTFPALCIASSAGAVPLSVPYQGLLTYENGQPYNGTVDVTAEIFDANTGGSLLWGPAEFTDVDVENGLLSLVLEGGSPDLISAIDSNAPLWLSFEIGGAPMEPRQQILSVPYAIRAGDAATVGGVPSAELLQVGAAGDLESLTIGGELVIDSDGNWVGSGSTPGSGSSSAWVDAPGQVTTTLSVGVKTASPQVTLDVGGEVRVGAGSSACSPLTQGAIRFNPVSKQFEGCDGTQWNVFSTVCRRTLTINNGNALPLSDYQVRVDISAFAGPCGNLFQVRDAAGAAIPFCYETTNLECAASPSGTNFVWLRLPSIPVGTSTVTFERTDVSNGSGPGSIFLFYDDFTSLNTATWDTITTGCPIGINSGRLRGSGAGSANEVCGVRSKASLMADDLQFTTRLTMASSGPSDCDPRVVGIQTGIVNNDGAEAGQGWGADDETPTSYLVNNTTSVSLSSVALRGQTFTVDIAIIDGQISVCQSQGNACSAQVPFTPTNDRWFIGSWAYGGIVFDYEFARIRRRAPLEPTTTF
jgi:hypothetical protein